MSNTEHNIKIKHHDSGMWFATSEDKDKEIFIGAHSYSDLLECLKYDLDKIYIKLPEMMCPKCDVYMKEGIVSLGSSAKTSKGWLISPVADTKATRPKFTRCLKCPECGHSVIDEKDIPKNNEER